MELQPRPGRSSAAQGRGFFVETELEVTEAYRPRASWSEATSSVPCRLVLLRHTQQFPLSLRVQGNTDHDDSGLTGVLYLVILFAQARVLESRE